MTIGAIRETVGTIKIARCVWIATAMLGACAALSSLSFAQAPAAQSQPGADEGAAIFTGVCAACHGNDLAGGRGPSLFNAALLQRLGDQGLHDVIHDGVPETEMPAFGNVYTPAQIDAIVAYLHRQSEALMAAPASPAAPPVAAAPNPDGQRFHTDLQDIRLVTVAEGLDTPWAMEFLPDGRMLVSERGGKLRVIGTDGALLPEPVAGLPAIHTGQDAGLFDIAVSPSYASDGWIYLAYAEADPSAPEPPPPAAGTPSYQVTRKPSMTVLVRGKLDEQDRWTEQQDIFRAPWSLYTPNGSHYGSRLLFDAEGHLFFTIGERGEMTNAARLDSPLGKIHRVNANGSIPADNPFGGRSDAIASIWSLGHRNPQGLAIDPATGLLWESEHGPSGGDEINVIERGADYGWGRVSKGIQPGIDAVAVEELVEPVAWYFPTIAPSGIAFYNGGRYQGWDGSLFVTALRGQQLRRLEVEGGQVRSQEVLFSGLGRVRDVVAGPDGLLYLLIQHPTGPGTAIGLSDPAPGALVRVDPIVWQQEPFRRPQ